MFKVIVHPKIKIMLHEHALWYSFHNGGASRQTGRGEEELLNKVFIFVFFAYKSIFVAL